MIVTEAVINFLSEKSKITGRTSLQVTALSDDLLRCRLVDALAILTQELEVFCSEMNRLVLQGELPSKERSDLRLIQLSMMADIQRADKILCVLLQKISQASQKIQMADLETSPLPTFDRPNPSA